MFRWLKSKAINSLTDVRAATVEFQFIDGQKLQIANPLRTTYDLVDITLDESAEKLEVSPFLYVWDAETIQTYKDQKGVWLSCNDDYVFIRYGFGTPPEDQSEAEMFCFFPVPWALVKGQTHRMVLELTCFN